MAKVGPLQIKTVRGEPIQLGDRTLIPVVRVVSVGQTRATIGRSRYSGWGWGLLWARPVAMLVDTPQGARRIRIVDGTSVAVRRLVWLAAGVTAVFAMVRWLVRQRDR